MVGYLRVNHVRPLILNQAVSQNPRARNTESAKHPKEENKKEKWLANAVQCRAC